MESPPIALIRFVVSMCVLPVRGGLRRHLACGDLEGDGPGAGLLGVGGEEGVSLIAQQFAQLLLNPCAECLLLAYRA